MIEHQKKAAKKPVTIIDEASIVQEEETLVATPVQSSSTEAPGTSSVTTNKTSATQEEDTLVTNPISTPSGTDSSEALSQNPAVDEAVQKNLMPEQAVNAELGATSLTLNEEPDISGENTGEAGQKQKEAEDDRLNKDNNVTEGIETDKT